MEHLTKGSPVTTRPLNGNVSEPTEWIYVLFTCGRPVGIDDEGNWTTAIVVPPHQLFFEPTGFSDLEWTGKIQWVNHWTEIGIRKPNRDKRTPIDTNCWNIVIPPFYPVINLRWISNRENQIRGSRKTVLYSQNHFLFPVQKSARHSLWLLVGTLPHLQPVMPFPRISSILAKLFHKIKQLGPIK